MLPPKHLLSKSSYVRSLQCSKLLYLYKFHYNKRDPLPENLKIRFQKGHDIGRLARGKFPGGIDCQPPQPWDYRKSIVQTQQLTAENYPVIYEAAFQFNRVLAVVDILVLKEGRYVAYEVKSSVSVSDAYLADAALQYFVISGCNLELEDFKFLHLNRPVDEALHSDEDIFVETSVKDQCISRLQQTTQRVEEALKILGEKEMPVVEVGEHCHKPYRCDFYGYCHQGEPGG